MAIVDKIDWEKLDHEVTVQQRNRETYTPIISLFRWWARRPHAVAGAILDAARMEFGEASFIVADPFSGGGTVAFEAVRRGLPIYAQDLYPWPSLGLSIALTSVEIMQFQEAKDELFKRLQPLRQQYWRKEEDVIWEITHVIKVRVAQCLHCGNNIYLFRDPLISLASRRKDEQYGFYGCQTCGTVSRKSLNSQSFKCDNCCQDWPLKQNKCSLKSQVTCSHCDTKHELNSLLSNEIRWVPILLQERQISSDSKTVVVRQVKEGDPIEDIGQFLGRPQLQIAISSGVETDHLLQHGFKYWGDLYTKRQLMVIMTALSELESLAVSDAIKARLRLAVLGSCEMAANLCRWERYHPKALEAIANHRFARSTLVVETNLLSPIGRGTIPRRLKAAEKALSWMGQEQFPEKVKYKTNTANRQTLKDGALVVTGSSERQLLKNGVAKLVLTDPPYHDDVQYGELSRLFHAWLYEVSGIPLPSEKSEAVPNRIRGTSNIYYEEKVIACLTESRRTLVKNGRLVLTFHNKDIAAWVALANALQRSGFVVVGIATVNAENAADHSKRGTTAFLSDLIIECIPKPKKKKQEIKIAINGQRETPERINLLAMGQALAEKINTESLEDLALLYAKYLKDMQETCVLIC